MFRTQFRRSFQPASSKVGIECKRPCGDWAIYATGHLLKRRTERDEKGFEPNEDRQRPTKTKHLRFSGQGAWASWSDRPPLCSIDLSALHRSHIQRLYYSLYSCQQMSNEKKPQCIVYVRELYYITFAKEKCWVAKDRESNLLRERSRKRSLRYFKLFVLFSGNGPVGSWHRRYSGSLGSQLWESGVAARVVKCVEDCSQSSI